MSSDESTDEEMAIDCTPPELRAEAELALNNLLPPKSKERYMAAYKNFISWKTEKNAHSFSETVFLAYFTELAKQKKSSTLWALYSMIKATMQLKHNINIKNYTNLVAWLKRQSDGYKAKKSRIFTCENVQTFLNQAPDEISLATKVVLILGINGACRGIELANITTNNIEFHDDIIIIKLCDTKTKTDRSFVIRDEFMNIFKKYYALRPKDLQTNKFFLNYRNGKCTKQVIGRHKILNMPKQIATFLNLDTPEHYTGHCFRRTSATLLADAGANLLILKRHGGWKSDKVAKGYIEDSVTNKKEITRNITKNIVLTNNTSITVPQDVHHPSSLPINVTHQHQYQSLYTNPQPGCSRDPPVFIEQHNSPPKFNINTLPISPQQFISSALDEPALLLSQNEDLPQPALDGLDPQRALFSQHEVRTSEQPHNTHNISSASQPGSEMQQTNISVPGKTITISITNCPNMSNVTFNIK